MHKLLSRLALLLLLGGWSATVSSCNDDDSTPVPSKEPPTLSVQVSNTERTRIDFTIMSQSAADYAYIVTENGSGAAPTSEEIFRDGKTGMLDDGVASLSTLDVEGGKQYSLWVAVRKINPYIYSEVKKIDLSTDIPYTKLLTLNKIGQTDFSYHVEVPEGVTNVKHLVVRKNDYEAVVSILAGLDDVTEDVYLKVFGLPIEGSTDINYDKYGKDASGTGFDIHIHSDNTFLAMAGVVGEDGEIDPERFECVEFKTRPAAPSPYAINVAVSTTSTSATISITPDPEIVSYRALFESKEEFDFAAREGEEQVRYLIIAHWDDSTNPVPREYTGPQELKGQGLIPNTPYVLGLVGYDAEGREYYKTINIQTGAPTGPAPTLSVTEAATSGETPWNSKAFNVKATNAAEVRYGFWTKAQIDEVLNRGVDMPTIIQSNGEICSSGQLTAIQSEDGLIFESNDLQAGTEYIFGVYVRTVEYVGACEYRVFTTDEMPQVGGAVRKNMPGNYIASTTDENGATVTFPVTITTGVNEATIADYSSKNRLVALGFGPADQYPYTAPGQITEGDPNTNYGPKWFIEFTDDAIRMPASNKSWPMGVFDGNTAYLIGYGERLAGSRVIPMPIDQDFNIEVSDDGNTITVKGNFWDVGSGYMAYPAMYYQTGSGWTAKNVYLFTCYSDLVLTRQSTATASNNRVRTVRAPRLIPVSPGGAEALRNERSRIVGKIK